MLEDPRLTITIQSGQLVRGRAGQRGLGGVSGSHLGRKSRLGHICGQRWRLGSLGFCLL